MPEVDLLKRLEGTWRVKVRLGGEERGRGVGRARLDYGGVWLVQDVELETERGLILLGFDPSRRAYLLIGLRGTGGFCIAYGTSELDGRVLRFQGAWTEPGSLASVRVQAVYTFEGPDRITLRFQRDDGRESGDIEYARP
jgi:hypothetical protein